MKSLDLFLFACIFSNFIGSTWTKLFSWRSWHIDVVVEPSGDIFVTEVMQLRFSDGPFTYGYRTIPIGIRGRNDGLDMSSIRVSELTGTSTSSATIHYGESAPPSFLRRMASKVTGISEVVPPSSGENYFFYVKRKKWDEEGIYFNFPPFFSGRKRFELAYRVRGAIRLLDSEEGLYSLFWKAIPEDHPATIAFATVNVTLPSTGCCSWLSQPDTKSVMTDGQLRRFVRRTVPVGRPFEIDAIFEVVVVGEEEGTEGAFASVPNEWQDTIRRGDTASILMTFGSAIFFAAMLFLCKKGRYPTPSLSSIPPPILESPPIRDMIEGEAPTTEEEEDCLTIAELGQLWSQGEGELSHVMAQLISLSIRGHLRIVEDENTNDFEFVRLRVVQQRPSSPPGHVEEEETTTTKRRILPRQQPLQETEIQLLDAIRMSDYGSVVRLSHLKYLVSSKLKSVHSKVDSGLVQKGYRWTRLSNMRGRWVACSILALIISGVSIYWHWDEEVSSWYYYLPLFVSGYVYFGYIPYVMIIGFVVSWFCAYSCFSVRTEKGQRAALRCESFKRHLVRLLDQVGGGEEGEENDDGNEESSIRNQLFAEFLPYVILFGLEKTKKWKRMRRPTRNQEREDDDDYGVVPPERLVDDRRWRDDDDSTDSDSDDQAPRLRHRRRKRRRRRGHFHFFRRRTHGADYFYYNPWYAVRRRGVGFGRTTTTTTRTTAAGTATAAAQLHPHPPSSVRGSPFSGESFTSRLSRMLSSTRSTFASVRKRKSDGGRRSGGGGGGGSRSSGGRSGGGGSAGFG